MTPLLGGPVAGRLGLLVLRLHGVVRQLALLAALEHVVGPLRAAAAATLTVHEAAAPRREGAPPPAPALHPGLLSVTIVVLEEEEEEETFRTCRSARSRPAAAGSQLDDVADQLGAGEVHADDAQAAGDAPAAADQVAELAVDGSGQRLGPLHRGGGGLGQQDVMATEMPLDVSEFLLYVFQLVGLKERNLHQHRLAPVLVQERQNLLYHRSKGDALGEEPVGVSDADLLVSGKPDSSVDVQIADPDVQLFFQSPYLSHRERPASQRQALMGSRNRDGGDRSRIGDGRHPLPVEETRIQVRLVVETDPCVNTGGQSGGGNSRKMVTATTWRTETEVPKGRLRLDSQAETLTKDSFGTFSPSSAPSPCSACCVTLASLTRPIGLSCSSDPLAHQLSPLRGKLQDLDQFRHRHGTASSSQLPVTSDSCSGKWVGTSRMSARTLPLVFINLGGEMLYILDQRLRALNTSEDQSETGGRTWQVWGSFVGSSVPYMIAG
ncbi:hypothetical protein CCH79_00020321 [Gambusia affinis]|uniref:Uncharacterized protein n=1 Tax=Gambusia affinis TaxID=33528 RepID=A0A315UST1_GAMAF|nr:hypothetical protein CCH79_00020321 [Gambusia affinis]